MSNQIRRYALHMPVHRIVHRRRERLPAELRSDDGQRRREQGIRRGLLRRVRVRPAEHRCHFDETLPLPRGGVLLGQAGGVEHDAQEARVVVRGGVPRLGARDEVAEAGRV